MNVVDVVVIHINRHGSETEITGDVAGHVQASAYRGDGDRWDGAMNDDGTRKYNFAELFVPVPITPLSDARSWRNLTSSSAPGPADRT